MKKEVGITKILTQPALHTSLLQWLFLIALILLAPVAAESLALDTVHALDDVQVMSGGSRVTVLLMPGESDPENWYYSTRTLFFGQQTIAEENVPEMTLIRYQRPDPKNKNKFIEGATLQLAVDIDPLDEAAKKTLLGKAKKAAQKWLKEYTGSFAAKLNQAAAQGGDRQEQLKALGEAYKKARGRGLDKLVAQAQEDGLDSWVIDGLREALRLNRMAKTNPRKPESLKALPMATAQLTLYDQAGQSAQTTGPTRGAAPELASEKLSFTIQLDRNAADISEAFLKSRTGIFLVLRREYEVLSSPLPYSVIIDYGKIVKEYRRNPSFLKKTVQFAAYLLPEKAEEDREYLLEQLDSKELLKVLDKKRSSVPLSALDTRTIQSLLARVNRAVLHDEWSPQKVNLKARLSTADLSLPAVRKDGASRESGQEKPSVGVRHIDADAPALSGMETLPAGYMYRERQSVISQGFLRLPEKESIQNQLIVDERAPQWRNAYFLLPGVGTDPQLGIFEVNATVALRLKGKTLLQQEATWKKWEGWTLEEGKKPARWGLLGFPLTGISEDEYLKMKFHVIQKVKCNLAGKNFEKIDTEYTVAAFDGKSMVASPLECIQPVIFDFSNFAWRIPQQIVYRAKIKLQQKLRPAPDLSIVRNAVPGKELVYLPVRLNAELENDLGSLEAQIEFPARYIDEKSGRRTSGSFTWVLNGEDLVELYPSLFISIFGEDMEK